MTATVHILPTRLAATTMRHVTLLRLDGRTWATAGFLPGDPGAPWAWIQETIAHECECNEDDVTVLETEDDGDLITADGIPVARVAFGLPISC